MTLRVSHATTVVTPDSGDGKVSSNAWNADHLLTGTAYTSFGFNASGAATDIAIAVPPQLMGAVGDGTTDDAVALQAWLDRGGHLYLPEAEYYSSAKLLIRKHVQIEGAGFTEVSSEIGYENQPGSRIRFAAGVGGFDIQPRTTETDVATAVAAGAGGLTQEGAACSSIKNLALVGANTGAAVTGLYSRVRVSLENVWAVQFTGKGFDISASSDAPDGNSEYGNANASLLLNCNAKENGSHGLHLRGRDANVCNIINFDAQSNGGWGIIDESIIGNNFIGPHTASNTAGDIKIPTAPSTLVRPFVESGGSTNIGHATTIVGYDLNDINTLPVGDLTPPGTYSAATCNTLRFKVHENQTAAAISTNIGYMFRSATYGTVLQGKGTSGDVGLLNRAGNAALHVSPNSLNVNCNGALFVTGVTDSYTLGDSFGRMLITSATGYSLTLNTDGGATGTIKYNKDFVGNGTLKVGGNPIWLQVDDVTIAAVTATGVAVTGTLSSTGTVSGSNLTTGGFPASVATTTLVGRVAGGTGAASALTGTQAATIIDAATTSLQGAMSAQDKTRLNALPTWYRTLLDCSGYLTAADAAGTYGMGQGDKCAITGTGTLYPVNSTYIAAADFPAVGTLNPKLRIRATVHCNDVAPGVTFTIGLHPITRPATSGGAGVCIYTIGSAVASSTIALATPSADSSNVVVTAADFSLPSDGHYVIGVVTSGGALAASSHVHITTALQLRYA